MKYLVMMVASVALLLAGLPVACMCSPRAKAPGISAMPEPGQTTTAEAAAGPTVAVRYPEGTVHGFLVLKDAAGTILAHGALVQSVKDSTVTSKTAFDFPDGSHFEERVTYDQAGIFTLRQYAMVARGTSFKEQLQVALDLQTGRYRVETRQDGKDKSKVVEGKIDLPEGVYNGMVSVIAKNLFDGPLTRVNYVAFTPEPKVIELELSHDRGQQVKLGHLSRQVAHFLIKPKLGVVLGVGAAVTGKSPPDNHIWMVTEGVPGFVRSQAPLVPDGPVWRIELAVPQWEPGGE